MAGDVVRRSRAGCPEMLALGALLAPFVVALGRAAVTGWIPVGDATYYTVRSRDVLTRHWPLIGAWSSGSMVVGDVVNTLGPLQLDLLAPFTKAPFGIVSPYLGTGIGSAMINAASAALVWFVARRLFGPLGVVLVSAGTLALMASLGLSWLIDVRPQHALVLPFFALLWLLVASSAGVSWALPWTVGVGSLLLQTHFAYAFQVAVVAGAAVACSIVWLLTLPRPATWRRPVIWAIAVGVVCWAQPVLDQYWGRGNLGRAIAAGSDQPGVGFAEGVRLLTVRALRPPGWPLGSIAAGEQPAGGGSGIWTYVWLMSWAAASVAAAIAGQRLGDRRVRALGGASVVALVAAVLAAAEIPLSVFGAMPQNYYWSSAVAVFVTMALGGALALVVRRHVTLVVAPRSAMRGAMAAVVVALAIACWPRSPLASTPADEAAGRRVGTVLRDRLEQALADPAFPDAVEIDPSLAGFGSRYAYGVLVELQRSGTEFYFRSGTVDLARFGPSRCTPGGEFPRLVIYRGRPGGSRDGVSIVAAAPGLEADDSHYVVLEPPSHTPISQIFDSLDVCGTRVGR